MGKIRRVLGDHQAGPEVLQQRPTKGFESEPAYREQQRGLSRNDPQFGLRPDVMAPHHILGIKDLAGFFAGSKEDNARLRKDLEQFGEQAGNAPGNYTGLYDGDLSPAGKKVGMRSSDHRDVHKGSGGADTIIKQLGIAVNRSDRTKDTYNGIPISELPYEIKRSLLLQYAYLNQRRVTQVQQDRVATMKATHPGDTYQAAQDRIKFNPTSFANVPRKQGGFIDMLRAKIQAGPKGQFKPKPKPFPNRLTESPAPISFFRSEARMVPTAPVGTLQGGGYRVDMDPMGLGGSIMLP